KDVLLLPQWDEEKEEKHEEDAKLQTVNNDVEPAGLAVAELEMMSESELEALLMMEVTNIQKGER
ncbi:MAG: hypothetical protein KDJ52_35730, partial [Anaerolineae bacterium]|nr:hypothetical protein [Anaerolineae bacterium]